jgi:hypothetical protein
MSEEHTEETTEEQEYVEIDDLRFGFVAGEDKEGKFVFQPLESEEFSMAQLVGIAALVQDEITYRITQMKNAQQEQVRMMTLALTAERVEAMSHELVELSKKVDGLSGCCEKAVE